MTAYLPTSLLPTAYLPYLPSKLRLYALSKLSPDPPSAPPKPALPPFSSLDLKQSAFLLRRAGDLAETGQHDTAREFYQVALTGMLRATKDDSGKVGETAAVFLAKALAYVREENAEKGHGEEEEEEEEEEEVTMKRIIKERRGRRRARNDSCSVDSVTEVESLASFSSMSETEHEVSEMGTLLHGEALYQEDETRPTALETVEVEEYDIPSIPTRSLPFQFVDLVLLLLHAFLISPFSIFLTSFLVHFRTALHRLHLHYNLTAAALGIANSVGRIVGWLDEKFEIGKRAGEVAAVGVVTGVKVLEVFTREVASRVELERERERKGSMRSTAPEQNMG